MGEPITYPNHINCQLIERATPLRFTPEGVRVGGVLLTELAKNHHTPLFVFDEATLREKCAEVRRALSGYQGKVGICYATKANANATILRIVASENFGADVVSAGELEAAVRAGIPADRIVFHGNAKTDDEIHLAIRKGIQAIVVDSEDELKAVESKAAEFQTTAPIAFRVKLDLPDQPGETEGTWSTLRKAKFGVPPAEIDNLCRQLRSDKYQHVKLVGLHTHIGSQKSEPQQYLAAAEEMVRLLCSVASMGFQISFLDLGGGLPVRYSLGTNHTLEKPELQKELEAEFSMWRFGRELTDCLNRALEWARLPAPELVFEPGRFMVAAAGVLLTTVQTIKRRSPIEPTDVPHFVAVDAGCHTLTDVWTYKWLFECLPIDVKNTAKNPTDWEQYHVVGPLCDSGDVLLRGCRLPPLERGDLLAFLQVGAYQLEQQSNFNLFPRAAAVLVKDSDCRLIRRRERIDDLVSFDII